MTVIKQILVLLLLLSLPAEARMYQWTDPDTGTTQLSGKPPSWYRSAEQGPRVIVFDKGRVIDDTKIRLSDVERDELRRQALVKVEEDLAEARQQMLEAEQLKAALSQDQEKAEEERLPDETAAAADVLNEDVPPPIDAVTAEQMKALIQTWEQQTTEQAKLKIGENEAGASATATENAGPTR